jgi:hypothetical protein
MRIKKCGVEAVSKFAGATIIGLVAIQFMKIKPIPVGTNAIIGDSEDNLYL